MTTKHDKILMLFEASRLITTSRDTIIGVLQGMIEGLAGKGQEQLREVFTKLVVETTP